jgi:class 3 adenylate cyclase/sensor domain CHASE-containing protein
MAERRSRLSSLRVCTLGVLAAITAALVLATFLPLRAVLLSSYRDLEEASALRDLERARNAVRNELNLLHTTTRDYATWDETFEFVTGQRPQYVDVNFPEKTFAQLGLSFVAIVDGNGKPYWSGGYDRLAGKPAPAPPFETLVRSRSDPLLAHLHRDVAVSGVVATPQGPFLVAAAAITNSTGTAAPRGTLMMGRSLDNAEVERLAKDLALDLKMVRLDAAQRLPEFREAAAELTRQTRFVLPVDGETICGYLHIDDLHGQPYMLLRVALGREIYRHGERDTRMMGIMVLLAGIVFGLATLVTLKRLVLDRVANLSRQVRKVAARADAKLRVPVEGRDELAGLATDINGMLDSLDAMHALLDRERRQSERLLLNVLPREIAQRLKREPGTIADGYGEASVLFADLVGFTKLSAAVEPAELVGLLNGIFSHFDALADRFGVEKIKTIGDAYMTVAGLPKPRHDHARAAVEMAIAMIDASQRFNHEAALPSGLPPLSARIGVHSGPVVAGVIGTRKFSYDLWGDTVNVASRMESTGVAGRVQVSAATWQRIHANFEGEARGAIAVKGKGEMQTWLVAQRKATAVGIQAMQSSPSQAAAVPDKT